MIQSVILSVNPSHYRILGADQALMGYDGWDGEPDPESAQFLSSVRAALTASRESELRRCVCVPADSYSLSLLIRCCMTPLVGRRGKYV